MELFQHGPLPSPTSIRVIRILPPPRQDPAESLDNLNAPLISCSMETIDLGDPSHPGYCSLSYTWVNPFSATGSSSTNTPGRHEYKTDEKHAILINDKCFEVQRNLYEALKHFQHRIVASQDSGKQCKSPDNEPAPDDIEKQLMPFHKTPLIDAAERGMEDYVDTLLRHGANVNAQDHFGDSALHYAAFRGHLNTAKLLVWAGASLTMKDRNGFTPIALVGQCDCRTNPEVLRFLQKPWPREEDSMFSRKGRSLQGLLWIDSLSINQSNREERIAQVALMGQIYAHANTTIVWLGPGDDHTSLAKRAATNIIRNASIWELGLFYRFRPEWNSGLQDQTIEAEFKALKSLMNRAWFERVWVIQEIARAKEIEVYCGEYSIPWAALYLYVIYSPSPKDIRNKLANNLPASDLEAFTLDSDRRGLAQLVKIRILFDVDHWESSIRDLRAAQVGQLTEKSPCKASLDELLLFSWTFRATDPRDKIYALMGLTSQSDIPVDYNMSIDKLFTSVARYLLPSGPKQQQQPKGVVDDYFPAPKNKWQKLEYLSIVDGTKVLKGPRPYNLPSWVPDFHAPVTSLPIFNSGVPLRSRPGQSDVHVVENKLQLHGDFFGYVKTTEEMLGRPPDIEELLVSQMQPHSGVPGISCFCPRTFFKICLDLEIKYPTGVSRVEALLQTVLSHRWGPTDDDYEEQLERLRRTFHHFTRSLIETEAKGDMELLQLISDLTSNDDSKLLPTPKEIQKANATNDHIPALEATPTDYWSNLWPWERHYYHVPLKLLSDYPGVPDGQSSFPSELSWVYAWRRLYTTSNGFIGVGPRAVKEGDEIWLVSGQSTPYVLRRVKGGNSSKNVFELVGKIFVHGIMAGEAAGYKDRHSKRRSVRAFGERLVTRLSSKTASEVQDRLTTIELI